MTEQAMQTEPMETSNVLSDNQGFESPEPTVSAEPVEQSEPVESSESIAETHTPELGAETQDVSQNTENAKKRVERKGKKMQRRLEELESRNRQLEEQFYANQQPEKINSAAVTPQQVVDPFTGEHLSPGTQRYETVLYDQQKQMAQEQRQAQAQQYQSQQAQAQVDESFFDSLDDASDRYEDFDAVVRDNNLPLTEAMLGVAKVTPDGADLLYYLAKNPKEVQRISNLHPLVQQQEMAKHAIKFASRKQVSSAPAPIKPVGDTSGAKPQNSFSALARNPSAMRKRLRDSQRRIKN